jgi:ribonuclease Z
VVGPQRQGRKVVILGDTSDSRSLLVAARGADVVVHEATVTEHEADFAVDRGHSTACIEFLYFTWQNLSLHKDQ